MATTINDVLGLTTQQELRAVLLLCKAVGDAIRDLGTVPEGELYVRCMGHMTLDTFNRVVDKLVDAKLVTRKSHVLTWVG